MKDIGLVGVPFSGKSTLFTALTRSGSHGGQANHAIVPVPDPRVGVLTELEHSRKTVHAQVGFVDVPGGTASAQGVAKLRETDALAIVVRCFGPDARPAAELDEVRADLLLADQAVIEPALEKARKRARGKTTPEVDALARANDSLVAETPLRDAGVSAEDRRERNAIAPLTLKPEEMWSGFDHFGFEVQDVELRRALAHLLEHEEVVGERVPHGGVEAERRRRADAAQAGRRRSRLARPG